MTFGEAAGKLAAQAVLILGWRPDDFWNATPAELLGILQAITSDGETPPDQEAIYKLMKRFPDD
ncbi:phage tail assembly chaperone [Sphingorhabdus sp.]|uniref:phage tail assembly chaperone n=1 Tax=Sphingorhabdus sp. TaxID=1902408 RepID=UPI00391BD64F